MSARTVAPVLVNAAEQVRHQPAKHDKRPCSDVLRGLKFSDMVMLWSPVNGELNVTVVENDSRAGILRGLLDECNADDYDEARFILFGVDNVYDIISCAVDSPTEEV